MAKTQSGKKLLEESTRLRWAKLANIAPMRESFEKSEESMQKEEEGMEKEEESLEPKEEAMHPKQEEEALAREILTQNQARARGDTDRLNESPFMGMEAEEEPDMGGGDMPPPEAHAEPDGDEAGIGGGEGDEEALFAAIAAAVTAYSGTPVEVTSDGAGGDEMGGEPEGGMPPAPPGAEDEMMGGGGMMEVSKEEESLKKEESRRRPGKLVRESESPVGAKVSATNVNKQPTPKKTMPGDQGTQKDPMKGEVRVKGAEKPTQMESDGSYYSGGGHKYKTLEEKMIAETHRRVYKQVMEQLKAAALKIGNSNLAKVKENRLNAASAAIVPARSVAKPTAPQARETIKKK